MKVGDIVYTANDNHKARPDILGHKVFAIGETYVLVQSGHGSLNLSDPVGFKSCYSRFHKNDLYLTKKDAMTAYAVKKPVAGDYVTAIKPTTSYYSKTLVQGLVVEVKSNWALKILSTEGTLLDIKKGCYVVLQGGGVN